MAAFANAAAVSSSRAAATTIIPRTAALTPPSPIPRVATATPRRAPCMVLFERSKTTPDDSSMKPIRVTGNNITLTESLQAYVQDKLSKVVRRFPSTISKVDVHLTVEHNPSIANSHKAEVVAFAGKTILRTEVRMDDMYAAIDAVEDRFARTVRKFKERRESRSNKMRPDTSAPDFAPSTFPMDGPDAANPANQDTDDEEEDAFKDVYAEDMGGVPAVTEVVRKKVFPMPLQTVEEAVLCCEYVDHPWYLFRNAATGEISLVYKRNHGGYGLIEPSNPNIVDGEPV